MKICGIDFTSDPTNRKPITLAEGELCGRVLQIDRVRLLPNMNDFSSFLRESGPWVAAIDFPFGQPRKLIEDLRWPLTWQGYVKHVKQVGLEIFKKQLSGYFDKETGRQLLRRKVDELANSISPMKLEYTPVGKMFFAGAQLLLTSPCTIVPFRRRQPNTGVVVEGYPKLVAKAAGVVKYKDGLINEQIDRKRARDSLIKWLLSSEPEISYGFCISLISSVVKECKEDSKGDRLDAVLCAVQAAWAYLQRNRNYGIPLDCDRLEGWIADPSLQDR